MTEAEFSAQLDVSVDLITTLRKTHLVEGEDFERTPEIALTKSGENKLLGLLSAQETELQAPPETILRITKTVANVAIVIAEDPEKKIGGPLTLQVPFYTSAGRALSHFRAGQTVRARHVAGATWAFVGPKPQSHRDPKSFISF